MHQKTIEEQESSMRKSTYPDGEFMGIRHGMAVAGVDDAVLADGHGIGLDVFSYALGVPRLQIESERLSDKGVPQKPYN